MRKVFVLQIVLIGALLSPLAGAQEELRETRREGEPAVYGVHTQDVEMNAAIAKAGATIAQFRDHLTSPTATQTYLALKVRFNSGGAVEHIWVDDVQMVGDQFSGVIANEPIEADTPARGTRVTVPPDRVSDWMVIDDDRLVGGYTLRVLRDRMSPEQRAEFDATVGFTID